MVDADDDVNLWRNAEHAINYLENATADPAPRRGATRCCSRSCPRRVERVLDLGTGDGNTLEMVLDARPGATGVGLDFQDEMLDPGPRRASRARRRRDPRATTSTTRCPPISGSSTWWCRASRSTTSCPTASARSTARCSTSFVPGGVFANVEHVASTTAAPPRGVPRTRSAAAPRRTIRPTSWSPVATHLAWLNASDSPTRNVFGSGGNLPLLRVRSLGN